jgi:hypothetical protein
MKFGRVIVVRYRGENNSAAEAGGSLGDDSSHSFIACSGGALPSIDARCCRRA